MMKHSSTLSSTYVTFCIVHFNSSYIIIAVGGHNDAVLRVPRNIS